jgi:hypothetical protein
VLGAKGTAAMSVSASLKLLPPNAGNQAGRAFGRPRTVGSDVRCRLLPAEHDAGTAALMVVLSWPIDRLEGGRDASDEI